MYREEPDLSLVMRVSGFDWQCRLTLISKKCDRTAPKEYHFTCEFMPKRGIQILQIVQTYPRLKERQIIAASVIWQKPPSWASRFLRAASVKYLEFCETQTPVVSVIIPIYNQLDYTLQCLSSIVANKPGIDRAYPVDTHSYYRWY